MPTGNLSITKVFQIEMFPWPGRESTITISISQFNF